MNRAANRGAGSFDHRLVIRADIARVWRAFTEPSELRAWHGHAEVFEARPGGRILFRNPGWDDVEGMVEDAVPMRLLRWRAVEDGSLIEETFEAGVGTTTVRIHHSPPDPADPTWQEQYPALALGWRESLADLVLYLEHGVAAPRHMTRRSDLGVVSRDTAAGIEIVKIDPDGPAAGAGLLAGDLLIQIGTAPLFRRSDLALLLREHPSGTLWEVTYVRDGQIGHARVTLSSPAPSRR